MELVGIGHGDLREGVKVPREDGFGDAVHAFWDDVLDAVLEERGGLDGALHATRGARAFLVIGNDTDEGLHLGPVLPGCDLYGERIVSGWIGAHLPGDEASEKRSACGPGALSGDEGKDGGGDGEGVQMGERCDEGGES